jgi:hypothetical protein
MNPINISNTFLCSVAAITLSGGLFGCASAPQEQQLSDGKVRTFSVPTTDYSVGGSADTAAITAALEESMYQATRVPRASTSYYNTVPLYRGFEIHPDTGGNVTVYYYENQAAKQRYRSATFTVSTVVDGPLVHIQVACPTSVTEVNQFPVNIPWNSLYRGGVVEHDLDRICSSINVAPRATSRPDPNSGTYLRYENAPSAAKRQEAESIDQGLAQRTVCSERTVINTSGNTTTSTTSKVCGSR